jgi:hypothetical protein
MKYHRLQLQRSLKASFLGREKLFEDSALSEPGQIGISSPKIHNSCTSARLALHIRSAAITSTWRVTSFHLFVPAFSLSSRTLRASRSCHEAQSILPCSLPSWWYICICLPATSFDTISTANTVSKIDLKSRRSITWQRIPHP